MAAQRALLTDVAVLEDPFARGMLTPSMAMIYRVFRQWPRRVPTLSVTLAGFAARVLWHDARLAAALDAGVDQVAVIGAGLDRARPALFILEGVTMYFSEEVVRHQLRDLSAATVPGSWLTTDFVPPAEIGTARDHRQVRMQHVARAGSGERFGLLVDRPQAMELVQACGWNVDEAISLREAALALVPRDAGLPVDAVNEHKTLVSASR